MKEDKYFVTSNGEVPSRIYFSADEAFSSEEMYIDVFDGSGFKTRSYKYTGQGVIPYTTDF